MIKVHDYLYFGPAKILRTLNWFYWERVNLSSVEHYKMHRWVKGFSYKDDPCYVVCREKKRAISINWIDGPAKFYNWNGQGVQTFIEILDFIDKAVKSERKVYVYCDQGISRSPSVALLYLAKRLHVLPDTSFEEAREKFLLLYPMYNPGGIKDFINEHWKEIK